MPESPFDNSTVPIMGKERTYLHDALTTYLSTSSADTPSERSEDFAHLSAISQSLDLPENNESIIDIQPEDRRPLLAALFSLLEGTVGFQDQDNAHRAPKNIKALRLIAGSIGVSLLEDDISIDYQQALRSGVFGLIPFAQILPLSQSVDPYIQSLANLCLEVQQESYVLDAALWLARMPTQEANEWKKRLEIPEESN
jgi:hypothetical protein